MKNKMQPDEMLKLKHSIEAWLDGARDIDKGLALLAEIPNESRTYLKLQRVNNSEFIIEKLLTKLTQIHSGDIPIIGFDTAGTKRKYFLNEIN
jgi:hypothetical protein